MTECMAYRPSRPSRPPPPPPSSSSHHEDNLTERIRRMSFIRVPHEHINPINVVALHGYKPKLCQGLTPDGLGGHLPMVPLLKGEKVQIKQDKVYWTNACGRLLYNGFISISDYKIWFHGLYVVSNITSNVMDRLPVIEYKNGSPVLRQRKELEEEEEEEMKVNGNSIMIELPLTAISEVRRMPVVLLKSYDMILPESVLLMTRGGQTLRLYIDSSDDRKDAAAIATWLQENQTTCLFQNTFNSAYKKRLRDHNASTKCSKTIPNNMYSMEREFQRMNLLNSSYWRVSRQHYGLCSVYPTSIVLPAVIDDEVVRKVAGFHRDLAVPVVCWKNPYGSSVILRSSSPKSRRGALASRCLADEEYLRALSRCHDAAHPGDFLPVHVFSERPTMSVGEAVQSSSTAARGGLDAKTSEAYAYPHAQFSLSTPTDIRTLRSSINKLGTLLGSNVGTPAYTDDVGTLAQLESTGWLGHVSDLLATANRVVNVVECQSAIALVAYDTGCDRTAQVVSLAQLMLDGHYRTLDGFQVLIQKEWLSFGHPFSLRNGRGKRNDEAPVFLLFLDAVWQMLRAFPFSFEFNEHFLLFLADHVYASRFFSSTNPPELDGRQSDFDTNCASLWACVALECTRDSKCMNGDSTLLADRFLNIFYDGDTDKVVHPEPGIANLAIWRRWYYRWHDLPIEDVPGSDNIAATLALHQDSFVLLQRHEFLSAQVAAINTASGDNTSIVDVAPRVENRGSMKDLMKMLDNVSVRSDSIDDDSTTYSRSDKSQSPPALKGDGASHNTLVKTNGEVKLRHRVRTSGTDRGHGSMVGLPAFRRVGSTYSALSSTAGTSTRLKSSSLLDLTKKLQSSPLAGDPHPPGIVLDATTCKGFLMKLGGVRKNWKRRWFVLSVKRLHLTYFESNREESPKGLIALSDVENVMAGERAVDIDTHTFYVCLPRRTYLIRAANVFELRLWVEVLRVAVAVSKEIRISRSGSDIID